MIRLEDRSRVPHEGLWAQKVEISSYQVVEQSYVAFGIKITTLKGSDIRLLRRYTDFDKLRYALMREHPEEYLAIPQLPPKSSTRELENKAFLLHRQDGLDYFVKCVMLNPYIARSQAIREFIQTKQ